MMPNINLPLGKQTLVIKESEKGYDFFLSDGEAEVKVMMITLETHKFGGHPINIYKGGIFYDREGHGKISELPSPDDELEDPVVMLSDGMLYCTKCKCRVVNTANNEMRKEGFYAHSHVCKN